MSTSVRFSTKFFYGIGSVAEGTKNTAFNVFLLFYYTNVLGLPGTLSGTAIMLALCVDAITDPLLGAISDDTRSRWGRRHPYMYAAALPMSVCFFLLFNPPSGLGQTELFVWLTCFAVGVRASMTLYAIPSGAMIPELTDDYDERTTLVSWRFFFGWVGGLGMSVLGYLVFFAPSPQFADGRLDPNAYVGFGALCSLVIFAAILLCAGGTHRLIPTLRSPASDAPLTFRRFFDELRPVLRNRSYVMMVFAAVFASVAGGFSDVVGLYMNTYFWEFSAAQIAILLPGAATGMVIAVVGTRPLTERLDKKRATMGMGVVAIFFGPLPIFLRLVGLMPENGSPYLLPLIVAHATMLVALIVSIGIAVASMIADVVDENELETGLRQEGIFTSAIAFAAKAASGLGTLAAGVSLDLIDFPRTADAGSIPPEKVAALGLVVGPGLIAFYLVTLAFVARYRITRTGHAETLAALASRPRADTLT